MAYSDFTIPGVARDFGLTIHDDAQFVCQFPAVPHSDLLKVQLAENVPLATSISTEKARSEFIIAPILMEVRRQFEPRISLFSGTEFRVDRSRKLTGVCDFLISLSPLQIAIRVPVVSVVEVKNEDTKAGFAQCIAEMVAADRFNKREGETLPTIYGAVTTGVLWKFITLTDDIVSIDREEFSVYHDAERIVGILVGMVREAQTHVANDTL